MTSRVFSDSRAGRRTRILILGGYGHFGSRISHALARNGEAEIWIAGRDPERLGLMAAEIEASYPHAVVAGTALDLTDTDCLRRTLDRLSPGIVIHTAGPFQVRDYGVAEACIESGSHYLDLADSRRFVADFARLDQRAKAADLLLVSGASSLPGLSSAVVDLLSHGMQRVTTIETSIVPAGQTLRGRATAAAVLSYCGTPVRRLRNGTWSDCIGWTDVRRIRYPCYARRVAVCDVPDLELFPQRYKGVETVTCRAGPELYLEHVGLCLMARLRRLGLVRDWARCAGFFTWLNRLTRRFGSDTGCMQVSVTGTARDGSTIERRWDLVAGSNHGHEIPALPAIALARKLLTDRIAQRGAMPCLGLIGLEDFAVEASRFDIDWNLTRVR